MGVFGNGWSMPGPGSALMGVIMLVILVLIVVGIVLLVRSVIRHDHAHVPPGPPQGPAWAAPPDVGTNSALRVLEERYARGEIDREDFLQRKQDILKG
jgi:putative membrane protein